MFAGHALGVVPVCQLLAAEVRPLQILRYPRFYVLYLTSYICRTFYISHFSYILQSYVLHLTSASRSFKVKSYIIIWIFSYHHQHGCHHHHHHQVFPTETRTLGSGICVAIATIANAINAKVSKTSQISKAHYYIKYSISNIKAQEFLEY